MKDYVACTDCDGRGVYEEGEGDDLVELDCSTCAGRGRVPVDLMAALKASLAKPTPSSCGSMARVAGEIRWCERSGPHPGSLHLAAGEEWGNDDERVVGF